jgi:hypothetical protein
MPLFPAAKMMDMNIGVDVHAVVGVPIHPYFGPMYLWHSPTFPKFDVFINGLPALSVGAMGYFAHIPQGLPVPPTPTNISYWTRYLTNIAMGITLTTLTIFANLAIANIAAHLPKTKSTEEFVTEVTGIQTSEHKSTWEMVKSSFSSLTQWQTWVKLLMPPIPFCGAQGSTAVGSPNVTVNGGPLAFVAPLVSTSCSDIPIVPNAATLGFTNVMVGVSWTALAKGLAVSAAAGAIGHAVGKGAERARNGNKGRPGCPSGLCK